MGEWRGVKNLNTLIVCQRSVVDGSSVVSDMENILMVRRRNRRIVIDIDGNSNIVRLLRGGNCGVAGVCIRV